VPNILLPVPWHSQIQEADCLAACAAMVLDFIGRPTNYDKILHLLKTTPYGTVASHLHNLSTLGVKISYREGDLSDLYRWLDQQLPVIVLVQTGELAYWSADTMHAVVVVGYDDHHFYLNDPHFPNSPIRVHQGEFDLAWFEMGNRCAVICI